MIWPWMREGSGLRRTVLRETFSRYMHASLSLPDTVAKALVGSSTRSLPRLQSLAVSQVEWPVRVPCPREWEASGRENLLGGQNSLRTQLGGTPHIVLSQREQSTQQSRDTLEQGRITAAWMRAAVILLARLLRATPRWLARTIQCQNGMVISTFTILLSKRWID
ncbi:hypothetical protein L226DRAFT_216215 [Lentinus tigrinus ALCF2SS1-7]|uniref:uncharacterized protein n=1 Tax=Lentinus tigrinus ALCF2SS1-7 TaxID=1328758 RepID=UPI0011661F20|nr:hypothetical protein L226DRAFT_216215 [Lentinus tigrinus ALCF2SS1-7]